MRGWAMALRRAPIGPVRTAFSSSARHLAPFGQRLAHQCANWHRTGSDRPHSSRVWNYMCGSWLIRVAIGPVRAAIGPIRAAIGPIRAAIGSYRSRG